MQLKKVRRRTTSSEALLHQKMEGTGSGVEAAETEAGPLTQQGSTSKSKKTRAEKDKHNESCRRSRSKKKREVEELKEKTDELEKELKRVKAEKQEKETELIQYKSKLRELENIKEQRYDTNQALRAVLEWMRQIPKEWKDNGQNFTSFEQTEAFCLSQAYGHGCHVSGTSGTVPQVVNGFVGLGAFGTDNFPPYMADLSQQMCFGQLNGTGINLGASTSAGLFVANHDFPFEFGASNSHGVWNNSTAVEHNVPEFSVTNNVDNLFNNDLDAGIPINYAAGPSSFGAYPNLENDCDLFTHGPAPGSSAL